MVRYGNMARLRNNKLHRPVYAAIHPKKLMVHRYDVRSCSIVGFHHHLIVGTRFQFAAYFTGKGGITAAMTTCQTTVHIDLGTSSHSFKTKKYTFTIPFGRSIKCFLIISRTFIKIVDITLHVVRIPRMRHAHTVPAAVPDSGRLHDIGCGGCLAKRPALIEVYHFTGRYSRRTC